MKKIILIILLFFFYQLSLFAQKEANNWYFPRFNAMNFTNGTAQVLTSNHMGSILACASISDKNGNLLFYTDADSVWNRNHLVMTNGTGMSNKVTFMPSSSLIVPKPGCSNIYYLFITEEVYSGYTCFQYAVIDMNQSNGLGAVISKRNILLQNGTAKITAVMHSNKNAYWVITHEWNSNNFYAYLVDKSGVYPNPVISSIGSNHSGAYNNKYGAIKVSPDGSKLITTQAISNIVELFSFNPNNGIISNQNQFNITAICNGLEFSASGKFLYISTNQGLNQFNTHLPSFTAINNSRIIVINNLNRFPMQIGLDKKIYGALNNSRYLKTINYPDSIGVGCNFEDSGLYLNGHTTTMTIPHFIQSYFFVPEFTASPLCQGDSTHFALTDSSQIDSIHWNFGEPSSGSQNTSNKFKPSHLYSDAGWYSVQVIVFHSTNIDTSLRSIRIDHYPSASFVINDTISCLKGNNFIFTNQSTIPSGNMTFDWDFGDSTTGFTTNISHSYSKDSTFNVCLVALSDYGCADTFYKKLYLNPSPAASFTINDSAQCSKNNLFSFTNTSNSSSIVSKLWTFGDGQTDTTTYISHTYSTEDSYLVKLLLVNSYGCTDTAKKIVQVFHTPKTNFSINDSSQCLKANLFAFSNQTINIHQDTVHYLWDFGDSSSDTATNTVHQYTWADTFNVRLSAITNNGCKDSLTKKLQVNHQPVASFNINDSSQCFTANSFMFLNTSNYSNGSFNSLWNFGDGITDTTKSPKHSYNYDSTFTVKLKIQTPEGCNDSIIKQVIVNPQPGSNFSINDSSQCLSVNSFIFKNKISVANTNLWSFGDGQTDTNSNVTHSYSIAGNYSVKLQTASNEGCTDSFSKTIIIFPQPKTDFSINDSIQCLIFNSFQFSNSTTGANQYLWDYGDGKSDTNFNSSHAYNTIGSFKIVLFATSIDKCIDSFIKQVSILQLPVSGYGVNDTTQCLNANLFQFNNKTTGASSYKWDFGDGNSDTIINPNHSYLATGSYNTRLISQSVGGCLDTSNLNLAVKEVPLVSFSVNDTNQILPGNSFIFSNLTNCKPASSNCKYLWDFGDNQTDTFSNPTHSYAAIGKYHVLLTATSTNGCNDTISLMVNVFNIIVNTAFTVKDVCLGDYAFFKNSSTIQFDSFQRFLWDFGDGSTISQLNPKHLYADTGTYKIQLLSVSYGGYKDTTYGKVIVFPSPSVEIIATPDSILEQGIKATLSANGSFDSLLWSTGAITASIVIEKAGIYSLRVVDANGCDAVDKIAIEYLPEKPFGSMNVITPNGDGINDVWKVWNIEKYQPCKLAIYNCWGDELYSTNDYNNNWDGKYKGKTLPEGTYYFVLITKNGKTYKGAVNVMK